MLVCMSALAVVSGTGMVMTTLSAKSLLLKPAFTFVFTSIRVLPSSVIRGVTCTDAGSAAAAIPHMWLYSLADLTLCQKL